LFLDNLKVAVNSIYQRYTNQLACLAIYLALFTLPISRLIANQALIVAVLCVLVHGNWRARWQYIWQFQFVKVMFAFLALLMLGVFYSQASLEQAIEGFGKYGKLLFIPFFLPLFVQAKVRTQALAAFIAGVYLCMLLNVLHHHQLIDLNVLMNSAKRLFSQAHPAGTFINPIPFSVLEAFASYILLVKVFTASRYKAIYLLLFLLGSYHLFFINIERTGMLSYLFLLGLFILQRLRWQVALLLMIVIVPGLLTTLYYKSANFAKRIELVKSDVAAYQTGEVDTSIGLRFSFWLNSWQLIKQAPLLGHGTGSFQTVYARIGGITASRGVPLSDPHNEYVLIAVEWGGIGLLIYLFWIWMQYREARLLPVAERQLLQGLLVTLLVSSLTHVVMYTNATGTLFVLGVCCFFAAMPARISQT
jgi:O-antigen ligase